MKVDDAKEVVRIVTYESIYIVCDAYPNRIKAFNVNSDNDI